MPNKTLASYRSGYYEVARLNCKLKNLVIWKLDLLANEIMLHDKLAGKLEIQENKNFWNIGELFWKDTELFNNKAESKTQTQTAKKGGKTGS